VECVTWSPDGKRVITGNNKGHFTLWDGLKFNFINIIKAHESAVLKLAWKEDDNLLISGDKDGVVKYWQTTMNNIKAFQAHDQAVNDISFAPSRTKFATASDDFSVKIWDFATGIREKNLRGHGFDVKCVSWHPEKGCVISGGKDTEVKVWNPKSGKCVRSIPAHKGVITTVDWHKNGNWFVTSGHDNLLRLWDIRTLKCLEVLKGHGQRISRCRFHPFQHSVIVSAAEDGKIMFWTAGYEGPQAEITNAHDSMVHDLCWHPLGHILTSTGKDNSTKFWSRNYPGDDMADKHNAPQLPEDRKAAAIKSLKQAERTNPSRKLPSILQGVNIYSNSKNQDEESIMTEGDMFSSNNQMIPGMGSAQEAMKNKKRTFPINRPSAHSQPHKRRMPNSHYDRSNDRHSQPSKPMDRDYGRRQGNYAPPGNRMRGRGHSQRDYIAPKRFDRRSPQSRHEYDRMGGRTGGPGGHGPGNGYTRGSGYSRGFGQNYDNRRDFNRGRGRGRPPMRPPMRGRGGPPNTNFRRDMPRDTRDPRDARY